MVRTRSRNSGCSNVGLRLLVAAFIAGMALVSYFGAQEYNPVTNEKQYVALTPQQEIALGLQSTPQMIEQYGGMYPDQETQNNVDRVGFQLVRESVAADTPWQFEFYVLDDPQTINAFALPGGQVFITYGLLSQLETEGQLAGVLAHEIVHVLARHSSERIAEGQLTEGLLGAVIVATEGEGAQAAALIAQLVNMKFGRDDELQSDTLGVEIMADAGYDPRAMIGVMEILAAAGGQSQPEFFSTHPNPENRIAKIEQAIAENFPNGVPGGLIQ